MSHDPYRTERLLALREVYRSHHYDPLDPEACPLPSEEYQKRRIMRDVAKHLNMSYRAIEDMSFDEVLQHHYEVAYEAMAGDPDPEGAQRWQAELERATETDEEREKREAEERLDRKGTDRYAEETRQLNAMNEKAAKVSQGNAEGMGGMRREAQREVASWGSKLPDHDPTLGKGNIRMRFPT